MESEHGSEPTHGLKTHPASAVDKGDISIPTKRLGSSSSSSSTISSASDLSSEDPFQEIQNAPSKDIQDGLSDESLPESTLPSALLGNSSDSSPQNGSAIQSPPVQMMERPGESSAYRIPSSVFARTKSTAPMEWSVASNESLFSIHMGNASFSRDHILLMGRSGELGIFKSGELVKPGDLKSGEPLKPVEATTSSQFMNYTNNQPPVYQASDIGRRNANLSQGVGATEAAAFETMKEVLRENEADRSEAKAAVAKGTAHSTSISRHSNDSGTSVKPFAFPILTGDGNKGSVKNGSNRSNRHQEQDPSPQPRSQSQTPAAKPDAAGAQTTSWFSCFSCCPFRS